MPLVIRSTITISRMTLTLVCFDCGDRALWHLDLGACIMPDCSCQAYNPKTDLSDDIIFRGLFGLCGKIVGPISDPCTFPFGHQGGHSWYWP